MVPRLLRSLLREKQFTVLNVLGLALGISISIILVLILLNDFGYDKFHKHHKKIYRLGGHYKTDLFDSHWAATPRELNAVLKEEIPDVEKIVRLAVWSKTRVSTLELSNDKAFDEEMLVFTDSTFFDMFSHDFIAGSPSTSLKARRSVVLTESTAKKYFGDRDPINKLLSVTYTGSAPWKVTGVIKDLPENSHIKFTVLLGGLLEKEREGYIENGQYTSEAFWNPDIYTYLMMPDGFDPGRFPSMFAVVYDKYYSSFGKKIGGNYTPVLEPLTDLHFFSSLEGDPMPTGNIKYVYAILGVGILIVILACINYMNLATAKSMSRAREIGMKKTLGSTRINLSIAVIFESIFTAMISLVIALVVVNLINTSPWFSEVIGRKLSLFNDDIFSVLMAAVSLTLLIGLLSGIYPALYLSRIPVLTAINGTFRNSNSSVVFRKLLIGVQLSISTFVITCTFFIQDQIEFVRNKSLGFNKENVLVLPIQDTLVARQINAIRTELIQEPGVLATSTAQNVLGMDVSLGDAVRVESGNEMKEQTLNIVYVGDNYLETLGISLLEGRDFEQQSNDTKKIYYLVNEAGVKLFGWEGKAIGKKVTSYNGKITGEIIGVVKDFNYQSLRQGIDPLLIVREQRSNGYLHVRIAAGDQRTTIESIIQKWKTYHGGAMTDFFFLDDKFNELYKSDEIQAKLLSGLSLVSIFVSLLGLVGLSTFNATQRNKEIGIRKILGADKANIAVLLSKDILIVMVVASIITMPLSYFAVSDWMSDFQYKVGVDLVAIAVIILSAVAAVFTVITVQSLKSMVANPADVLRSN